MRSTCKHISADVSYIYKLKQNNAFFFFSVLHHFVSFLNLGMTEGGWETVPTQDPLHECDQRPTEPRGTPPGDRGGPV